MQKEKGVSTLIGIIIIVAVAVILIGGVLAYECWWRPEITPTVIPIVKDQTAGWKTNSVEPYPGSKIQMKYPQTWGSSELSFPCKNPNDQVLAVISPARTDLPGYKNISVSYLVQFCAFTKLTLSYQGFIRVPLTHEPTEGDKIVLSNNDLQNTNEYTLAQEIIKSVISPTDQTAGWKTYTNNDYGFEIKYPDEAKIDEANIIGGASITFQISSDKRKRIFEVQMIKSPLECVSASGADTLNVKIDGADFIKYYESRNYSANISTSAYKYCAVVGNIVYNLIPRIESSNSFEADSDPILKQMLSTFKFTK